MADCGEHETGSKREAILFRYFGRVNNTPGVSPFETKLETYLRAANVPYKACRSRASAKGKTPWASFGDEPVADSFFVIERLKSLGYDLDDHLTPRQSAVGVSFLRMLEEATLMCMATYRYQYFYDHDILVNDLYLLMGGDTYVNRMKIFVLMKKYRLMLYLQGTGRHSLEEINFMLKKDLNAISTFLGENKFFFGDNVSTVDCSLFAFIVTLLNNMPSSPGSQFVKESFPNLVSHMETMKGEYWPDYNEIIISGN